MTEAITRLHWELIILQTRKYDVNVQPLNSDT
jgi:hypothetical protein